LTIKKKNELPHGLENRLSKECRPREVDRGKKTERINFIESTLKN